MSTPIIIVAGKAGSGKDTVASYIAQNYNGVCVAQADPMKRFAKRVLGFTDHQLWGPSEARNALVPADQLSRGDFHRACEGLGRDVYNGGDRFNESLEQWFAEYIQPRIDKDGGISARVFLQTHGTEWGRKYFPTMWIDTALQRCKDLVTGGFSYTREGGVVWDTAKAYDYAIITDGRFRNEILGVSFLGGTMLRIKRPSQDVASVGIAGHKSESELDTIPEHLFTGTILNNSTFEALYSQVDDQMVIQYGDVRTMTIVPNGS